MALCFERDKNAATICGGYFNERSNQLHAVLTCALSMGRSKRPRGFVMKYWSRGPSKAM